MTANHEGRIVFDLAHAGPALRDLRLMLGIGQREFARRIAAARGTDPQPVSGQLWGWETGKTQPTAPSLAEVIDVLGFDVVLVQRRSTDAEPDPRVRPTGPATTSPAETGRHSDARRLALIDTLTTNPIHCATTWAIERGVDLPRGALTGPPSATVRA